MGFFFSIGLMIGVLAVFYVFLAVAAFSQDFSMLINTSVVAVLKDVVGPVSAGFGGAIAGAYSAYYLQLRSEENKNRKADFSVVHKTTIQLSQKFSELISLKKQNIYPHRDSKIRFLEIPMLPSKCGIDERVDTNIIDVLLSVGAVSAIDIIILADARYRACFENFENRNKSLGEYRAIFQQSKFAFEEEVTLGDIGSVVEVGRLVALNEITELMLEILDETLVSLNEAIGLISTALDSKYKGSGTNTFKMDFKGHDDYFKKMPAPFFTKEKLREYLRANRAA